MRSMAFGVAIGVALFASAALANIGKQLARIAWASELALCIRVAELGRTDIRIPDSCLRNPDAHQRGAMGEGE